MWAITTTIAVILVLIKKWLSERCGNVDQPNETPEVQQHPNPAYSPGNVSLLPLMVMHTPPSSITTFSNASTPDFPTVIEVEDEEEEEEEPIGRRTRLSCAKRLNFSKTTEV